MNTKQKLFVEAWLESKDRLTALEAAGYRISSRVNANVQFRRLIEREDVKLAIARAECGETPVDEEGKQAIVDICWAQIRNDKLSAKDRSAFVSTLTKLQGWDKQVKVKTELLPPTFTNMPFTPTEEPKP